MVLEGFLNEEIGAKIVFVLVFLLFPAKKSYEINKIYFVCVLRSTTLVLHTRWTDRGALLTTGGADAVPKQEIFELHNST